MLKRQICSIRVVGKLGPQRDTRVFHTFSLRMSCVTYCEAFCTKTILVTRRRRREFCRKTFLVKHEQKGKGVENPASLTWGKLWGVNTIIRISGGHKLCHKLKLWTTTLLVSPNGPNCFDSGRYGSLHTYPVYVSYSNLSCLSAHIVLHQCNTANYSCLSAHIALQHCKLLLFDCTYCCAWV